MPAAHLILVLLQPHLGPNIPPGRRRRRRRPSPPLVMIRAHLLDRTTPLSLLRHVMHLRALVLLISVHLAPTIGALFQAGQCGGMDVRT